MPCLSDRGLALNALTATTRRIRKIFIIENLVDLLDGNLTFMNETNESFIALLRYQQHLSNLRNRRYLEIRSYRRYDKIIYERDLRYQEVPWLTEKDFKVKYRTSREGLDFLTTLLEDAPVFTPGAHGPKQMPVKYQIMIWLHFFGHEGMTVEAQRETLHTCKGLLNLAKNRVTNAFNSIRGDWIHWPDAVERKEISRRIEEEFFLPNCVAIMDGTLLPLGLEPDCTDKADYHGRKYAYSITCNILCDDKCRIRNYLAGFPGSTHDSRVWRNMDIYLNPKEYFDSNEYVLTDTAYEPDWFCIPAYKCISGNHSILPPNKTEFNFCLARPRVKGEHVMGIWKGRIPFLRSIRMTLTDKKDTMEKILRVIDATVVFHNIMMDFNDSELPDDLNLDDASTITDIDDPDRAPCPHERLVLDIALADDDEPGKRREQLLRLVEEHYIRPVFGSPVTIDMLAMIGINSDNMSDIRVEIIFSD